MSDEPTPTPPAQPEPHHEPDKPKPTDKPDDPNKPKPTDKPDDPTDEPDKPPAKPHPAINLYGQTYERIVEQVLGGRRENFQLMNPWLVWEGLAGPQKGYVNPQPYRFAGQVPKWTATGTYAPGGGDAHQAYLKVLSLVNVTGSGAEEDRIKAARKAVDDAQKRLADDIQQADEDYIEYRDSLAGTVIPVQSYDDWYAENWKSQIDGDKVAYSKALNTLAVVIGQKDPSLKAAMEAATPPTDAHHLKPGFVKYKAGSDIGVLPDYITEDADAWVARVLDKGGLHLSIHLSASASSTALSQSWAGGSGEIKDLFFAVHGKRGWEKLDLETKDKTVTVNITIKAFGMVEVTPDSSWYNSGLLRRYAIQDTWNAPYSTSGGHGKKPVFGKGGVFPLRVTSLIVGYQPSIDIKMSEATYKKHHERWNTATGIRVGPFVIGGKGGHGDDTWSKHTDPRKFHVESHDNHAYIMGITVKTP